MSNELKIGLYGLNGHQIHKKEFNGAKIVAAAGMPYGTVGGDVKYYGTLSDMLKDERIELVSICSPRRCDQAEDAIACLNAKKHVLCEKPAVLTEKELERVLEAASANGCEFHEIADTVFCEPYNTVRELVRSGTVGTVVQVYAQKSYPADRRGKPRPADEITDGGLIRWVGIHAVRMVEHLTGLKITDVTANETKLTGNGYFTAATLNMTLSNGGVAAICMNCLNPHSFPLWGNECVRIFGSRGMIEITDGGKHTHLYLDDKDCGELKTHGCKTFLQHLIDHFNHGTPMPMTQDEELHPLRVVIRAKENATADFDK